MKIHSKHCLIILLLFFWLFVRWFLISAKHTWSYFLTKRDTLDLMKIYHHNIFSNWTCRDIYSIIQVVGKVSLKFTRRTLRLLLAQQVHIYIYMYYMAWKKQWHNFIKQFKFHFTKKNIESFVVYFFLQL